MCIFPVFCTRILCVSVFGSAPIICPFAALYFALGFQVMKYRVIYIWVNKFQTGGLFWLPVFNKVMIATIIAQLAMIGLFGLKQVPIITFLALPLPFITWAFWHHMHT